MRPPLFEMNKLIKSQTDVIANDYGVDCHGEAYNQDLKQMVVMQIPLINQYHLLIWTVEVGELICVLHHSVSILWVFDAAVETD